MPKRKSQIEDDEFVIDEEPPQPASKNGKHSRKGSDVVDNGGECESPACELAKPEQRKSTPPTLEAAVLDRSSKETPDANIDRIAAKVRRNDYVEATPPGYDESPVLQPTPPGIIAEMPVLRSADRYNMSHPKRGTCLVFSQEKFELEANNLKGYSVNADQIRTTFSELDFDVTVHRDLNKSQVLAEIEALSKQDHRDNDCVCVFVLTHGHENDELIAYNTCDVYSKREIWEPFTADKCPTLAGKPKLFFFQACRGDKVDGGVNLIQRKDSHVSQAAPIKKTYKIPITADFLFAHSCAEGFLSWLHPEHGAWYVESLCKVLDESSQTTDLLKMLTSTARRVATQYKTFNDKDPKSDKMTVVPSVTSTLTRDLYFTPK